MALVAVVLGLVVAGTGYALLLGPVLRYPDERAYLTLAEGLANLGRYSLDGVRPTAFFPPGYPALLAFFLSLGAGVEVLKVVNYALLGVAAAAVYAIGRREGPTPLTGVLAALGVAVYPVSFYTAGTLYAQTLATALFASALAIVTRSPRTYTTAFLGGLCFGLLILVVPTFAVSLGVVAAWQLVTGRRAVVLKVAATLVAAALVTVPWVVRNANVVGEATVATNAGVNLLLGNSTNARPNSGTTADISRYTTAARHLPEAEQDLYYRHEALRWVASDPGRAALLYAAKVVNYFNVSNELWTKAEASSLRALVLWVSYALLGALVLARIVYARRRPLTRAEWLLVSLYLVNALFSAIFFTRLRFRIPYDIALLPLAASMLDTLLGAPSSPSRAVRGDAPVAEPGSAC